MLSEASESTEPVIKVFGKIVAERENRKFLLNTERILYFYSENDEVKIAVDDECTYYVGHTLQFWEKRLSEDNFFRCHKAYLVNLEKVIEIIPYFNSTLALKFIGHKNIIPVGRKFLKGFKIAISW